jgi:trigger factor
VKTAVEELSPTRVRLSVEVSFEELKPSLDKAYREVSRQVRIPGFRPGRVPPPVIDRRIGRAAVLTEAVNDALPDFYSKAVREAEVRTLGQPDVKITQLDDGKDFTFTAEVEVRPKFELPDLTELSITVDNATVTPDDVEEYLNSLRERFASLKTAQRPAGSGDYTTIDLSASVDGKPVEDAQASGLSYQIGSGTMLEGLDEALTGMSAGESKTFTTELMGGEFAGQQAEVTVTVQNVKVKELPELDDDFAQLASEFDALGELRADARRQLMQMRRLRQATQARDRAVEALVDSIDLPLPEKFVEHELEHAREAAQNQLSQMQMSMEDYLQSREQTEEEFDNKLVEQSQRSVKVALILDELARGEDLNVNQAELSYFIADQAQRMGVGPEHLARQLTDSGQIGTAITEVLRGKAAALVTERVRVVDEGGNPVDIKAEIEALNADVDNLLAAQAAAAETAEAEEVAVEAEEVAVEAEEVAAEAEEVAAEAEAAEDEAAEDEAAEDEAAEDEEA